jgi:hypothetical protein
LLVSSELDLQELGLPLEVQKKLLKWIALTNGDAIVNTADEPFDVPATATTETPEICPISISIMEDPCTLWGGASLFIVCFGIFF